MGRGRGGLPWSAPGNLGFRYGDLRLPQKVTRSGTHVWLSQQMPRQWGLWVTVGQMLLEMYACLNMYVLVNSLLLYGLGGAYLWNTHTLLAAKILIALLKVYCIFSFPLDALNSLWKCDKLLVKTWWHCQVLKLGVCSELYFHLEMMKNVEGHDYTISQFCVFSLFVFILSISNLRVKKVSLELFCEKIKSISCLFYASLLHRSSLTPFMVKSGYC